MEEIQLLTAQHKRCQKRKRKKKENLLRPTERRRKFIHGLTQAETGRGGGRGGGDFIAHQPETGMGFVPSPTQRETSMAYNM